MVEEERLSRQKLAIEIRLKRVEHALARRQLILAEKQLAQQQRQNDRSPLTSLFSPTGVVLVGAALGLLGTALGKYADFRTTKRQQETAVILKASEVSSGTPAEQQAIQRARNLLWFARAHYIELPEEFIAELEKDAKLGGAALSAPVIQSGVSAPPSVEGLKLVGAVAGFKPNARQLGEDWLIGISHKMTAEEVKNQSVNIDGAPVPIGNGITPEQAERLLVQDMAPFYRAVDGAVKVRITPLQRDSLASFAFSVGQRNFLTSTLLKKVNAGDNAGVAAELKRWSKASGMVMPSLSRRRELEAAAWDSSGKAAH